MLGVMPFLEGCIEKEDNLNPENIWEFQKRKETIREDRRNYDF